ncbi:hypothetical protein OESDEN_00751 [Oesophagostomum dentatum]|uniref:Transposase n=1 Tax=Oesophagostomum dentatum TaxID=61180 RepID=A0A0B1TTV7_OESDE|nr:hypothetical protein OESDEN_00751 [Oesophagostomum dentatum]
MRKELEIWRADTTRTFPYTQLQARVDICMNLLSRRRTFAWTRDIITGDEKWVAYVNVTLKRQWLQPVETGPEAAKPELHPRMVMLSVWWNTDGVIY